MSFMPSSPRSRIVPGYGRPGAKIAIVGEYTNNFDDREMKPFSGPGGTVLESCLHAARLIRGDVYLTNVFKSRTNIPGKNANSDFFDKKRKRFTEKGLVHVAALQEELDELDVNVIVAAGDAACAAISSITSASKYRGYLFMADKLGKPKKFIPTFSPEETIYKSYHNRHVITADLQKARHECEYPELIRPELTLVYNFSNVEEVLQWLDVYANADVVSFDIEVINYTTACFSFADRADVACVVPIGPTVFRPGGWTLDEEALIWRGIQRVLGNPKSIKIAQNSIFDIQFILAELGVVVRGELRDTMIGHSVMFPDLPKGLGFLGSIYCGSADYWKDAVKFDNIKEES